MAQANALPDCSAPVTATRGMATTGLTRDLVGRWYVGNGRTMRHPLLFSRLSLDLSAIEVEFDLPRLGIAPEIAGSCQGMTLDRSGRHDLDVGQAVGGRWTRYPPAPFRPMSGALLQAPLRVDPNDNGIAHDPFSNLLCIVRDTGQKLTYDKGG